MDELEFLDNVVDSHRPPDLDATSIVPLDTPGRRRREPCSSPDHLKDYRSEACGSADSNATDEKAKKPCPGCARRYGIDFCFYTLAIILRWAFPEGRGQFCSDCHTVWRTIYSSTIGLTFFVKWLEDEVNFDTWRQQLSAFCSFRKEGVRPITVGLIADRVESYKFMSRFLGTPIQQMQVVPLKQCLDKDSTRYLPNIDVNSLITLVAPDASCQTGVMVPQLAGLPMSVELTGLTHRPPCSVPLQ